MKCPLCGGNPGEPTKSWEFRGMTVEAYDCAACKKKFRAYLDKDGKLRYTIPKAA